MHGAGYRDASGLVIVPYKAAHLLMLDEQDAEKLWGGLMKNAEHAALLEVMGPGHTAMRDGKVLACVGLVDHWPGRATAWAMMAKHVGADYIHIHRATLRMIKLMNYRRIETSVACNFVNGIRWAELLGFKRETPEPMRGYGPDGSDHYLYARVK